MTAYFIQAFIYLSAAVIAVPLAKRLGLGSVLGYLIAGVVIGPIAGLVGSETSTLQHFAEFGVVMMLFLVGLELEPRMLWNMRHKLIGLGGLQVGLSTLVVMGIAFAFGFNWSISLTVGMIFSLSSTAIVLQTFNEKNLTKTEGGKNAFSVLLFQDIAVIPMLALIPLLALPELIAKAQSAAATAAEHHEEISLVAGLPGWAYGIVVLLAIAIVVVGGHYLSRPLFRYVASSKLREIFTAAALMLVIGIAALMSLVGLSPALGTFLAGVVLANSEFRHELESVIEPFKGLLLGLFFITVGAGIDFDVLASNIAPVMTMTLGVILIKVTVLLLLAMIFKIKNSDRWLFALSLAQAGEFGFVLLSYTVQNHVIPVDLAQILSLVVALSMFLTPGLFILFDKVILPRYEQTENTRAPDVIDEKGTVIIAGVGRFGQIVNRLLVTNGFKTVVLDHEAQQVENLRKINTKSFYGDATQPDLLHTAGIAEAKMLVIAIDNPDRAVELTEYIKHTYPNVIVLARAFDRSSLYRLRKAGADFMVSETFHSALQLGKHALTKLGVHPFKAEQQRAIFFETEMAHKDTLYESWKMFAEDDKHIVHYRDMFIQLEETLSAAMKDERYRSFSKMARGWTPPPKENHTVFSKSEAD
ncbi:monovalent cation:proton antiporter-2 (CPA2) family protein [Shewanella abyssi]|uniref:monovalent cation:proton antiporter-2 (CPA2) family protein n=1 Tax=Shewanella abyssi TaxID=311789 RepID=UPI00200D1E96|nr:monovalent cation:proton antiporter-2 (CPA2) family protein [Shewanella abyssi]MCL1051694.1 monovalent cation:proton antiporter-2 (CPA2) family protein [Shewanella abyssi]